MKRVLSLLVSVSVIFGGFSVMPTLAAEEKMPKYQSAARQMEKLNRGLIAVKTESAPRNGVTAGVYLSWRLLGDESLTNQAFDIYRNNVKIFTTGSHDATCFMDTSGTVNDVYKVVKKGESAESEAGVKVWTVPNQVAEGSRISSGYSLPNSFSYVDVPIVRPDNVTDYKGDTVTYYGGEAGANDASVGDLDGDGDYEIVLKWNPDDAKDSASSGYTGNVYFDAYEINEDNGGYMWRIDMGKNICAGAHYTQFMVYDFDGDGKSEIAMKTAPGTIDGTGRYVTEVGDTAEIRNADNTAVYLNSKGVPSSGGEYVTIFDGETGEALCTTDGISRDAVRSWGDSEWNRSERYLAAVAYIDGKTPHFIECRGYYAAAVIRAYKWDGSALSLVWEYKGTESSSSSMYGQGNHNLSIGDVDNDGKDEIVYGSAVLDDDGRTVMGNTRLGHGDAMHMSDFNNDGVQEVFSVKEDGNITKKTGEQLRVAATGEVLYGLATVNSDGSGTDNGRGVMANIDDEYAKTHPDALALGWSNALADAHDLKGNAVGAKPNANSRTMTNFLVYWDGDLSREMLDDNQIGKYDAATGSTHRFYHNKNGYIPGTSNNGSKHNPCLSADLWGDWREEIILQTGNSAEEDPYLRIFTSTILTSYRLTTLMHDCQYRLGVAWQNVAYNQPPHTSYYIGSAALAVDADGVYQNYLAPQTAYTVPYYVTGTPVEGIDLPQEEITLKEGQSYKTAARLYPENATRKGIVWESDNDAVAIASGGNITAVGKGECTITATTRDGGFTDSCRVKVIGVQSVNALDEGVFTSASEGFSGGSDYAYLTAVERNDGAYFERVFTPYYENKAILSFRFNTGGQKLNDGDWGWDGREYTFGIEFLDEYGNNILNIAQSYRSKAEQTTARVKDGGFEEIKTGWSSAGTGEEPMGRSSTTWYVTIEFDYDADICTAAIVGSDKQKSYTKVFPINAMSFKTLRYWLTKDGSGTVSVGPSLSELDYSLTMPEADAAVQIVSARQNAVEYLAYDKNEGVGVLIGAAYDKNGSLVFCESEPVTLSEIPSYGTMEFKRSIDGYKIGLFVWKEARTLTAVSLNHKTAGILKKLVPEGYEASAEPEEANGAKNIFDGNTATAWASQGVQSVVCDLGNVYTVTEVRLAFLKYGDDRTIPFTVFVSQDGEDWEVVYSGNSVPLSDAYMNFFTKATGRYVRVEMEGNSVSGWNSLAELEIYGE